MTMSVLCANQRIPAVTNHNVTLFIMGEMLCEIESDLCVFTCILDLFVIIQVIYEFRLCLSFSYSLRYWGHLVAFKYISLDTSNHMHSKVGDEITDKCIRYQISMAAPLMFETGQMISSYVIVDIIAYLYE